MIKAQRGTELRAKGWRQEAILRLLENNLENAEDQDNLVVYGALGKAARNWPSYYGIVNAIKNLEEDETLVVQSGKPIGVLKTHKDAPIVILANCNLIGHWSNADYWYSLYNKGLTAWGGLTAGDWQYIGSQGVVQGTYEIFKIIAKKHFNGSLAGKFILTAGLGGMGGSQPLAGYMADAAILVVEVNEDHIDKRIETGYLQYKAKTLDEAIGLINTARAEKKAISVGLLGNAAQVYQEILDRNITPDIVSDQTAAQDLLYGYVPEDYTVEQVTRQRATHPDQLEKAAGASIAHEIKSELEFQRRGSIVFDNGNNIRTQAHDYGVDNAFDIPIFTEAFLRDLFVKAIGPFRWIALSGDASDIDTIDDYLLKEFADNELIVDWITKAHQYVPFQALPARIGWLGHGERTKLALAVNDLVASGKLKAPVAFTRDHLDAGAMTHPNIMTENLKDGSDAVTDWPLINAMVMASSKADLVAIHSGGGGYTGYMQSAGVTVVADGTKAAAERLKLSFNNDTSLGLLRYADAGYDESLAEIEEKGVHRIDTTKYQNSHP
ncbi:urocanate hydratase [Paucilactobacillus suebicus]|uniref:Urocanate hydratase n=1 Tax=Paucilactobacillus suebicus DSM 5007 = KCTC 3549 TaxID=1423807 RepID=A0A0R1W3Z4_9LACO|nr:urocanate hydratase [Paucilactobacillus suebicus]KRM10297.1 urocanate hydratase [Paucilactobacillus suebicus DSM 5007 = KCTC 3549]